MDDDLIPLSELKSYMQRSEQTSVERSEELDAADPISSFLGHIDKTVEVYYGSTPKNRAHNDRRPYAGRQTSDLREKCKRRLADGVIKRKRRAAESAGLQPRDHAKDNDICGGYKIDPEGPTMYAPGSEEKIKVMEDRAKRKVAIFHPLDCADRS